MADYFSPIPQRHVSLAGYRLAGGPRWFERVEHIRRGGFSEIIPAEEVPPAVLEHLTARRAPLCGVPMDKPSIMGILNVTPDSFSDGGDHQDCAVEAAIQMLADGADFIDIGGESTRPGAGFVEADVEITRVLPVIEALQGKGVGPLSIDTRKSAVAKAAIAAGARMFNDVTALTFDNDSLSVAAQSGASVCLMHAAGTPETMQHNPQYADVLLDVYDYLEGRVQACVKAGVPRSKIIVDPGIGFGKTDAHSFELLNRIGLFQGLGCAVMLGVSRKSIVGRIAGEPHPKRRFAGSIALALEGLNQGVQMLRVHDITETKQAIALWGAMNSEG